MATPSAAGRGRWASVAPAMAAVVLVLVAAAAVASSFPIRPATPSSSGRRSAVVSAAGGGIVRGGGNAAAARRRRRCRRGGRIIVADEVRVRLNSSPDGGGDGDGGDDVFVDADRDRGSDGGGRRSRRKKPRLPDRNLYDVLGADPSMSRGEIKRLYIALARETHPDSAPTTGGGGGLSADEDRFNDIARAWTVLSDPKLRRDHDRELAAADFRDDVVRRAEEAAREYGPAARKFYDEFAIPLLRRGAATTVAGWSAAVAEAAATASNGVGPSSSSSSSNDDGGGKDGRRLSGATLSEVVKEVSEMQRRSNAGVGGAVVGGGDGMEDFGRAFRRVIEAGVNATRQIDGMELGEKSLELRRRAEEMKAESMTVLGRLTEIKSERLRFTFRTPAADFTSSDAIQYLGGFEDDGRGDDADADAAKGFALVRRMTSRHPVRQDVEAFAAAEEERDRRAEERSGVDRQIQERQMALLQAEKNAVAAVQAEERARKMLEDAQRRVAESQRVVADAQKSIRDLNGTMRRADQDLSKADATLKRKRDVVRRELKRKADEVEGSVFDRVDDGDGSTEVKLNPGFDRSSMDSMGFQGQNNAATIEALRQDEQRIEEEFLQLVDKASRLMSRSERLRLRSEELIGKQQQQQQQLQQQQQQQSGDTGDASFR